MSATIPESMRLDDLLKATGYDCPVDLQGKTFDQATEGGGADLEDNKTVSITENGVVEITPSEGKDGMKKVTVTVKISGGGSDVPTIWYLWQDQNNSYFYLPFTTAPDTLDSTKVIFIGQDMLGTEAEIEAWDVTDYTKNSDTECIVTHNEPTPFVYTFTRITEDVPTGGSLKFFKYQTLSSSEVEAGTELTIPDIPKGKPAYCFLDSAVASAVVAELNSIGDRGELETQAGPGKVTGTVERLYLSDDKDKVTLTVDTKSAQWFGSELRLNVYTM